ncbi:hypothetical protein QE419_000887 [Brevundimonas vesicularis]|uniref:hypothetical protein n=1 Tax=Brevundimonas vesicularis TaxID=41276 RepID=UPI00278A7107|nr:hypothetical protein [Brevundimonas vesicularis]MDQ1192121.1 hypothetical protein [Brevundimonas vesicularis]
MSSTTYFSWLEPIALTDQTLKAFDERLRRYGVLARRDMVARHDLNPDEVQTPDDAMKLHAESGRWRFESIAKEMPKIESVRWAVTFQNGIRRSGMNLNEILDLPNAGDSTITSLSGSSGALGYMAEVQFSVSRSWPSKIELSGDYIHVQAFKDELSQLLKSSTRNWSIVTKGWVGFLVAASICDRCILCIRIFDSSNRESTGLVSRRREQLDHCLPSGHDHNMDCCRWPDIDQMEGNIPSCRISVRWGCKCC